MTSPFQDRELKLRLGMRSAVVALVLLGLMPWDHTVASRSAAADLWYPAGYLNHANSVFQHAVLLHNGLALFVSGHEAELYDPSTNTWSSTGSTIVFHAVEYALALLPSGNVLLAGPSYKGLSAEIYDPDTGTWQTTGSMIYSQVRASSAVLLDGRVLVAGGCPCRDQSSLSVAVAELYDPSTGTWSPTGGMYVASQGATATTLPDGRVLVAGGWQDIAHQDTGEVTAAAELYDPKTNSWRLTGGMNQAREWATSTLLPDGEVLVLGGDDFTTHPEGSLSSAEIYDPSTGTWRTIAPMLVSRRFHTATLLADGNVLVAGGDNRAAALSDAEIYDPASNTWSSAGNLRVARLAHAAVLLPDGDVLFAGGSDYAGAPSDAELYGPIPPAGYSPSPTATPTLPPSPTPTSTATLTPTASATLTAVAPATPTPTSARIPISASLQFPFVRRGAFETLTVRTLPHGTIWLRVKYRHGGFKTHSRAGPRGRWRYRWRVRTRLPGGATARLNVWRGRRHRYFTVRFGVR